jgi:hypothetical protein
MPRKKAPPKKPERSQEEKPPELEAEPEGGPLEREREWMEERLTPLIPKGTPRPPAPMAPEEAGQPSEESAAPSDFRRKLVEEYRRRQQTQQPPAAPEADLEGLEPPEPPQPPPANNWIPIGPSVVRQGQGGVKPATSGRTPAIAVAPGGTRI